MSLINRLVPLKPDSEPEDFLSSGLSVIFPNTVAEAHGSVDDALLYTSPHLPRPLRIELSDPSGERERVLFAHHLWNSSLLAVEFIERGSLGVERDGLPTEAEDEASKGRRADQRPSLPMSTFDVRGKSIVELGAGGGLPSTVAALLGAEEVYVTDYPSPSLLSTLRANVARNIAKENSPTGYIPGKVQIGGHMWGDLATLEDRMHAFDIVIAADCLWMSYQHQNLLTSISHLLKETPDARAWLIAGFHTGRHNMRTFFDGTFLRTRGLELEAAWEVDYMGVEREWAWEREDEDASTKGRWSAVGILKWAVDRTEPN
ncbi:related to NNT1 Putative nicotinamide N-methyltransferase, has a role in rDNA silencing and in lifespan determination [Cephalotrichum gorgonifer]|uniref:Related to NNT1 Putative nicotinamide N-methyltransferase, has a role in rDNA silencing and in lifespan determination n=1 Tax=Cephalotrichum gorgonifer TaxID=2041049 RepID=A0AAE8MRG4_9PEZI|nr:related to NNT1 Putative nicotinamide N-methyltransferase, has a role in rDNA silencing and in lifespan determination [Cephalotrichum gorgonifer]